MLCLCVVVISLSYNRIRDQGASEIGVGLHGVSLLMSLKYVTVMHVWVMYCTMGRGAAGGVVRSVSTSWSVRRGL